MQCSTPLCTPLHPLLPVYGAPRAPVVRGRFKLDRCRPMDVDTGEISHSTAPGRVPAFLTVSALHSLTRFGASCAERDYAWLSAPLSGCRALCPTETCRTGLPACPNLVPWVCVVGTAPVDDGTGLPLSVIEADRPYRGKERTDPRTTSGARLARSGAVAQSVDEERDHALAVRDALVCRGLAQSGDGVQEILRADVGTNLATRRRGVEQ